MRWLACLLCLPSLLWGSEAEAISRIQAFLVMEDIRSAVLEAENARVQYPQSAAVNQVVMEVYARQGNEREMIRAWEHYAAQFPERKHERKVLETLCWGTLHKGMSSSVPLVRLYTLVGAGQSRDVQAVEVLLRGMRGSNEAIRSAAIQFTLRFRDAVLIDEIRRLWKEEPAWAVRAKVVQAIGGLQLEDLQHDLERELAEGGTAPEMRAMIIAALLNIFDEADAEQVETLLKSERAALRILACRIATHFGMDNQQAGIIALLKDPIAEVRSEALLSLGFLRSDDKEVLHASLSDPDPKVAITAAWALTLTDDDRGRQALGGWLQNDSQDWRIFASGAIAASGAYGLPLAEEQAASHDDPFVRLNLAIALIRQRKHCAAACSILNDLLQHSEQRWMRLSQHPFQPIAPSTVHHHPLIPRYPEAVHQATQLEILNLLAILRYPGAQEAIRRFLQERPWGIGSYAAMTLLQEGDDSAIALIKELLDDPDPQTQIQAALVLAHWGNDPEAIDTLMHAYPQANRRVKEVILDSLGKIPSKKTWPFLAQELKNPSQTLRIIAAASLLQSLNG